MFANLPTWAWWTLGAIAVVVAVLALGLEYWAAADGVGKMLPGG